MARRPMALGGLTLDLPHTTSSSYASVQSFKVLDDGTFLKDEFVISKDGICRSSTLESSLGGMETDTAFPLTPDDLLPLTVVGHGTTGYVKRAVHHPTGVIIALKIISVFDKSKRQQLLTEIRTLYDSANPNIVSFFGAFYNEGTISIGLEYMDAGSLADVMGRTGPMPEHIVAYIAKQVLNGLKYLHGQGVVHRDLKPSNLLMNHAGEVKITDFGVCADLVDTQARCKSFVGTVAYMSPERVNGEPYAYPSDVWGLGICLIECALGQVPYPQDLSPWEIMQRITSAPALQLPPSKFSPEFYDCVRLCLQKNPDNRPTVDQLLSHPFIAGSPVTEADAASWLGSTVTVFDAPEPVFANYDEIGKDFVVDYYRLFETNRDGLSLYYRSCSTLSLQGKHMFTGVENITNILKGFLSDARHTLRTVDCQPTVDGVLVMANGTMTVPGDCEADACRLSRVFYLRCDPDGSYWVSNDTIMSL